MRNGNDICDHCLPGSNRAKCRARVGDVVAVVCAEGGRTVRRTAPRRTTDAGGHAGDSVRLAEALAHERHVTLELQRAILPLHEGPFDLPGLRAVVRYLPASRDSRVGGDWYITAEMPGGHVLIAIGDVGGHGLAAAASAIRSAGYRSASSAACVVPASTPACATCLPFTAGQPPVSSNHGRCRPGRARSPGHRWTRTSRYPTLSTSRLTDAKRQ